MLVWALWKMGALKVLNMEGTYLHCSLLIYLFIYLFSFSSGSVEVYLKWRTDQRPKVANCEVL